MITVTPTLLANRAFKLSKALVGDRDRIDQSRPRLEYLTSFGGRWLASVPSAPRGTPGRMLRVTGDSPHAALDELVAQLRTECGRRGIDADAVLRPSVDTPN